MKFRDKVSSGNVHSLPEDLRRAIVARRKVHELWEDITPLARSEWICWVTSGKKLETRNIRIEKAISKLSGGMRRPCCWAGCPHRCRPPARATLAGGYEKQPLGFARTRQDLYFASGFKLIPPLFFGAGLVL